MSTQKNPLGFPSHLTAAPKSHYSTSFEFYPAVFSKKDKKTLENVYKPIKNAEIETIAVNLSEVEGCQQLTFTYSAPTTGSIPKIIGSFNLHPDMTVEWITDPMLGEIKTRVAISAYSALVVQFTSLDQLFTGWLMDDDFTSNAKVLASRLVYPPKLMKMIYLWLAYHDERSGKGWEEQELSENTVVSLDKVGQKFKGYIERFAGDVAYMKPYYSVPDSFRLFAPGQAPQITAATETLATEKVVTTDEPKDETPNMIDVVDPTQTINITAVEPKKVEDKQPKKDPNTEMLERLAAKKQSEANK